MLRRRSQPKRLEAVRVDLFLTRRKGLIPKRRPNGRVETGAKESLYFKDFDQASGKMRREVGIKKEGTWLLYFLEKEARRWRGPAV